MRQRKSWLMGSIERRRFIVFQVIIISCALALFVRLTWIQLFDGLELSYYAEKSGKSQIYIPAVRGAIYDRNGQSISKNLGDYVSLSVSRTQLLSPDRLITDLAKVVGRDREYFHKQLSHAGNYITLARKVPCSQALQLKKLGWGLIEEVDVKRAYPYHDIAGQLIGFTDVDSRGISGIEYTYDHILKGEAGWRSVEVDVFGNPQIRQKLPYQPAVVGGDVVLTMDISIQSILYEELCRALEMHSAKAAHGLVLNPATAEILAMASLPSFDPNSPHRSPVSNQKNPVIANVYEPGSTFKLIIAALLLEKGLVDEKLLIDTSPGYITVYDHRIHDFKNYGVLSFEDVIVRSSNVGMIKLSEPLKSAELYECISNYGLLGKTGIELPGEVGGMLNKAARWSGTKKPNVVIGQGVAVTMLSMAMFFQMIANDGVLLKPTIIYGVRHPDGSVDVQEKSAGRRILSDSNAHTLSRILHKVVAEGTGKKARIDGVNVAGKTATSQKPDFVKGGYTDDGYWSSFVGYFPLENPQCLIMIMLDEPANGYHGGSVAAPAFKKIADRIIELNPSFRSGISTESVKPVGEYQLPNYCGQSIVEAKKTMKAAGLTAVFYGSGNLVHDQSPPPGAAVNSGSKIILILGPELQMKDGRIVVPVLKGLSIRDAIRKASGAGLTAKPFGSGRVFAQSLSAGDIVSVSDVCEIIARQ